MKLNYLLPSHKIEGLVTGTSTIYASMKFNLHS